MRLRFLFFWLLLLLGRALLAADVAVTPFFGDIKPQSIRTIQTEATLEDFRERSVAIAGVVTWSDPSEGKVFYVQDETGGVQVSYQEGEAPNPQDVVQVLGVLRRGTFSPVVGQAVFQPIGRAAMPGFRRTSPGGIINGVSLGERVEVEGRVRTARMVAPTVLGFDLVSGTARIFVRISNIQGLNLDELIACKVRARGVVSPVRARGFDKQLIEVQILVNDSSEFFIDKRPSGDPWSEPLVSLAGAFQYRPGKSQGDRWHVGGQVILVENGVAYLNDGESGLAVKGLGVGALRRGEWVEAVGFTDLEDHLPVLSDTVFAPAQKEGRNVTPTELPPASLLDGLRHASYVSVTGQLLDRMLTPAKRLADQSETGRSTLVLALQNTQGFFTAELNGEGAPAAFPEVELGSVLRLSGVCLVQMDASGNAVSFRILVPSSSDITVVERAGFFTVKRLLLLLSLVLAVLLFVIGTAFLLARRNVRLLAEMRERQAVAGERNRIARDLHDTLEQGLMGIHLQLYGSGAHRCENSPENREWLAIIRRLVHQCHSEMRRSIWNLRSTSLDHCDLGEALERTARSLAVGSTLQIEVSREMGAVRLPAEIEDDLLRIGQEALANVVKHSGASQLRISLRASPAEVILTVSDNGRGVPQSSEEPSKSSSFGILGMRERAKRMGGEFEITNAPESGCTVRVTVPLNFSPTPESPSL